MSLLAAVRDVFEPVLREYEADPARRADRLALVRAAKPDLADYQANFAMPMAKELKRKPQELAAEVVAKLPASGLVESATVAGPGFINVTLSTAALAERLRAMAGDARLGLAPATVPDTVVIDYSGPNVAKPLHVGHLRSTVIGDAIVRILRAVGHTVIGDNHLGDWGTQFGILLYGYKHHLDRVAYDADPVRELARLYVAVRAMFVAKPADEDDAAAAPGSTPPHSGAVGVRGTQVDPVQEACRLETAKLHAGDPENVALWQQFMPACLDMLKPIYQRLGVTIDHAYGESFYNPMLPGVVADLLARGLAVESNGAVVVPNAKGIVPTPEEMKTEDPPALIRKRDGAFTYTTTDLATVRFRAETFAPTVCLYVVDARQALHFKTIFANAKRWGYDRIRYAHVAFGSVLGPDRKPLRTRDGRVPELNELLDDAVAAARVELAESRAKRAGFGHQLPELTEDETTEIAEVVGVGAVKYTDLGSNRTTDYVFDPKRMVDTDGNTAAYMQYAYARCRAIFRKGGVAEEPFRDGSTPVTLDHPAERALALALLRYPEAVHAAAAELAPHLVAQYLWDVAKALSGFYEQCLVLTAETAADKAARLQLVDLTGRVIRAALDLLGIRTVEQM